MTLAAVTGLKHTPLAGIHRRLGAKMVDFGGWEMPVEYSGIRAEHQAVRQRVGVFDVSHMGEFEVSGSGALDFLQRLTTNDVSRLLPGRIHYSAMLTPRGTFIDDLLVYRRAEDVFLLVVNAGNLEKDWSHAGRIAADFDVKLHNVSDDYGLLAIQGPRAQELLSRLTKTDLGKIAYYAFEEGAVAGYPCLISRTGYTGEDGFELYCAPAAAPPLWQAVMEAGKDFDILPCGLGARDTLRLEAKMALYGHDIDDEHTPWEADLAWIVRMDKGDFEGRPALEKQKAEGIARRLAGFELLDRGIARQGYATRSSSGAGVVTSGIPSPTLGKAIGLAYLPVADTAVGTTFEIDLRGRPASARVVETPFYKRAKKKEGAP